MRPDTLAEAIERIQAGEPQDVALAEFVDTFLMAPDVAARYATLEQEPARSDDARLNALAGAMAEYLAKFRVSPVYEDVKKRVKKFLPQVPLIGKAAFGALDHVKDALKASLSPHQIFEQLGFVYVGPTDGHDLPHLMELLEALKDADHPVLLHVHTQKGRGAEWACAEPTKFHSPKPFKVEGCRVEIQSGGRSYTAAFADALIRVAREDRRVFALTAAMPDGTGLNKFQQALPERFLDGGIAESATVDIAAGMCKAGMRPVAAI